MSSALAVTVSKIKVPRDHLLLGIHPILAVHFQTDDVRIILKYLRQLTKTKAKSLIRDIESAIQSAAYPHKNSVWMFNDPNIEVDMLTQSLINEDLVAGEELQNMIEMYYDSYPFIEVLCEPLICPEEIIPHPPFENPARIEGGGKTELVEDKGLNPLGAFFIPTAALGSLYILSKYAKESKA